MDHLVSLVLSRIYTCLGIIILGKSLNFLCALGSLLIRYFQFSALVLSTCIMALKTIWLMGLFLIIYDWFVGMFMGIWLFLLKVLEDTNEVIKST